MEITVSRTRFGNFAGFFEPLGIVEMGDTPEAARIAVEAEIPRRRAIDAACLARALVRITRDPA